MTVCVDVLLFVAEEERVVTVHWEIEWMKEICPQIMHSVPSGSVLVPFLVADVIFPSIIVVVSPDHKRRFVCVLQYVVDL